LFKSDTVQVAVEFEPEFGRRLASGQPARILVTTDATEPNSGTARQFYVDAVIQGYEADQQPMARMVRADSDLRPRPSTPRARARISSCPA
jgi:hypothetical protein